MVTRRGLIRFLATAATSVRSVWPQAVCESNGKEPYSKGSERSLQLRSMFFSPRSPNVQILCSIGGAAAARKLRGVRVNDELIPCAGEASLAGSYWQCDNTDLVIFVEERVVHFNLSRFPDIEVLLTENDAATSSSITVSSGNRVRDCTIAGYLPSKAFVVAR
jgi:hypothetical protein